nr:brassinosteroid-related acyltransferase 1 [Quercus suber]
MYLVFFYNPSHANKTLSLNSVFSSLKSGLEETLSVWYPAAGRLCPNRNDGKLDLWCNNNGAVLVEAVTQVKISQLGDLSQYNDFLEKLVYKPVFDGNFSTMPLVVAQVTKFGCGGYSIGFGASHSLFDGPATYDFLCAWASNSAIMKAKGGLEQQQKPVHERGTLLANCRAPNMATRLSKNPGSVTRAAAIDHLYQLIMQATTHNQNLSDMGSSNQKSYLCRTFHLSGAMIESLKRKVLGQRGGSFTCSSFDVVAAHLWKARTRALGVRKETMVCLQFAVDTRNKMVPPLPNGFSGNAYVLASVALTAGALEEQSHETIVEKIREAKNSISNDYVNAYVDALEGPQGSLPPLKELTIVSDWTRMPFHKISLLHGEAAYASPLVSPIPQVAFFIQNPNDNRGIDVRIGLLSKILDPFSHYFLNGVQ